MNVCQIPGKLFLIGEYGVIEGGDALVAAIRPGFTYYPAVKFNAHPESPLGRYNTHFGSDAAVDLNRLDSLNPGFGTSTAELIAALWLQSGMLPQGPALWSWYKETFPRTSGADLLAQIEALRTGKALFQVAAGGKVKALPESELFSQILVFQTDVSEKLPTHEALAATRPKVPVEVTNNLSRKLQAGFLLGDERSLKALGEFAELMNSLGLETEHAKKVRLAFQKNPSVISAKGCGAGLHDVFLVAVYRQLMLNPILDIAREHRLHFLGSLKERMW